MYALVKRTFLILLGATLVGCATGNIKQTVIPVMEKDSRVRLSRVIIIHSGDRPFAVQNDIVSALVGSLLDLNIPATISSIDSNSPLSEKNAIDRMRSWDARNVIRVHFPHRTVYGSTTVNYIMKIEVFDLKQQRVVWMYNADVSSGPEATPKHVVKDIIQFMKRDGLI